jgi:hypothetical protein
MFSGTCARRMVGPLAAASLLVAMLVMAPRALAEAPPAPSAVSSLLAQASWHGRPIVHPRRQSEPRAALPPIRSIEGWSAGAARRGLGFVRPSGSKRVREVQRLLVRIGYRPGRIDGRFGPRTEAAVLAFQYKHGFVRSGVVGSRTLRALRLRAGLPAPARRDQRTRNAEGHRPAPVHVVLGVHPPPAHPHTAPSLPTAPILIGLGLLGLIVCVVSYVVTGRRLQRGRPGFSPSWEEEP